MDQTVLVHANINECTKSRHVAHCALKLHALAQILDVVHTIVEARHFKIRTRVAARFFELSDDVFNRDHTKLVVGKQLGLEGFEHVRAAHQLAHGPAGMQHDLLNHAIGLWVNAGHVERVSAGVQAKKTSTLLKGFGTQASNFQQVSP